jgi:hypothetical protein
VLQRVHVAEKRPLRLDTSRPHFGDPDPRGRRTIWTRLGRSLSLTANGHQ